MLLGIGTSGPQVAEGWHGQRFGKQLQRTREYVETAEGAARERLTYDGETYQLPLPDGPGKALKPTIAPVQERIPIYIASIGPKNTQLTGEIADGWLPIFFSPSTWRVARAARGGRGAAALAGRRLRHRPSVNVAIDDDVDSARDRMRHFIALYVGGMGSRERNFYNQLVQRRVRGRGARDPGPHSLGEEGRGRGRGARRADRHRHAGARATRCATGSPCTATRASGRS